MKPRHLSAFLALMIGIPGWATASSGGTAGAEFLKISNGVRAVAMGSSYAAVGDDIYSVYFNPAGIGNLEAPEAAGSFVRLFDNAGQSSLLTGAVEIPKFPLGVGNGALGFMVLGSGDINSTDPGALVRTVPGSASDIMLFASHAAEVIEGINSGLTFKWVRRSLTGPDSSSYQVDPVSGDSIPTRSVEYQAYGAAFDAGLLWETWDRAFGVGVAVQNIGLMGGFHQNASLDLGSSSELMPVTYRVGGAMRSKLWGQSLLATADIHAFADSLSVPRLSLGAEYGLSGIAFFRMGWEQSVDQKFGKGATDIGPRTGLSTLPSPFRTGFGLRMKLSPDSLVQLDYALAPFGTLGTVNYVSMLYRWNIPAPKKIEAPIVPERPKPAMVIEPKQLAWKEEVKEWKVEVTDEKGRIVKTFAGTGLPPKTLDWDGTDDRGKLHTGTAGKFNFVMQVKDVKEKVLETRTQVASVGVQARLKPVAGKAYYPDVAFTMPTGTFKKWKLTVLDSGKVLQSWDNTGEPPREIKWSGMDPSTGRAVPLKAPSYSWEFIDEGGEKSTGQQALPQVEAEVKPALLSNKVRLVGVRFKGADQEITDVHRAVMEKAAQFISEHPGAGLSVESFSDIDGSDDDNFQIAKQRAEKVLRALVEEYGVSSSRISMRVYGRSRGAPRYPNIPEDEQRQRVDIVINVRP